MTLYFLCYLAFNTITCVPFTTMEACEVAKEYLPQNLIQWPSCTEAELDWINDVPMPKKKGTPNGK